MCIYIYIYTHLAEVPRSLGPLGLEVLRHSLLLLFIVMFIIHVTIITITNTNTITTTTTTTTTIISITIIILLLLLLLRLSLLLSFIVSSFIVMFLIECLFCLPSCYGLSSMEVLRQSTAEYLFQR